MYTGDWSNALAHCGVTILPRTDTMWTVGHNRFIAITSGDTEMFAACPGSERAVETVTKGMWHFTLRAGCRLLSANWDTLSGERGMDLMIQVPIHEQDAFALAPDLDLGKLADSLQRVNRPRGVDLVADKVKHELTKTGWSIGTIVALGLGILTIVLVLLFAAFVYFRLRLGDALLDELGVPAELMAVTQPLAQFCAGHEHDKKDDDDDNDDGGAAVAADDKWPEPTETERLHRLHPPFVKPRITQTDEWGKEAEQQQERWHDEHVHHTHGEDEVLEGHGQEQLRHRNSQGSDTEFDKRSISVT